jgi:hypothetical protein
VRAATQDVADVVEEALSMRQLASPPTADLDMGLVSRLPIVTHGRPTAQKLGGMLDAQNVAVAWREKKQRLEDQNEKTKLTWTV